MENKEIRTVLTLSLVFFAFACEAPETTDEPAVPARDAAYRLELK